MSTVIKLEEVHKVYHTGAVDVHAVRGVSAEIQAREFVAIMGASGSGKSTLMNIIGCLDRPTSGSYRVLGKEAANLSPDELAALRRETFGFVFQRYNLLATATAGENVEIPSVYAGLAKHKRAERATNLLQRLGHVRVGDLGAQKRALYRPKAEVTGDIQYSFPSKRAGLSRDQIRHEMPEAL